MTTIDRIRGLRALLTDAVDQGTSAVERVHKATAARPFAVLELTPVAAPARVVRAVHDATVTGVYAAIRGVNHIVGKTLEVAIDAVDEAIEPPAAAEPQGRGPGPSEPEGTPGH